MSIVVGANQRNNTSMLALSSLTPCGSEAKCLTYCAWAVEGQICQMWCEWSESYMLLDIDYDNCYPIASLLLSPGSKFKFTWFLWRLISILGTYATSTVISCPCTYYTKQQFHSSISCVTCVKSYTSIPPIPKRRKQVSGYCSNFRYTVYKAMLITCPDYGTAILPMR